MRLLQRMERSASALAAKKSTAAVVHRSMVTNWVRKWVTKFSLFQYKPNHKFASGKNQERPQP
jgi:hypothetical protein